jgi:hypothetical protein
MVQELEQHQHKFPKEIKGIVVASIITNPENSNECFLIPPKDYVNGWGFKDYLKFGFKPLINGGNEV